jgi:GH18 family chitinase
MLAGPDASPVAWDEWAQSPYADLNNGTAHAQLRFDTPRSLRLKFARARALGLRGVGVWNGDQGVGQPELWEAFDAFLDGSPAASTS